MKFYSDRKYYFSNIDLMGTYSRMAMVGVDTALTRMNLQSISDYESAIRLKHYTFNILKDTTYLQDHKADDKLKHPTFLRSNMTYFMRDIAKLSKSLNLPENEYSRGRLIESTAYIQRIASNVLGKNFILTDFVKADKPNDTLWDMQKEICEYQRDQLYALESADVSDIIEARKILESLIQSQLEIAIKSGTFKIPLYFRALFLIKNLMPAFVKLSEIVRDVITKASSILSYAASSLTNWGDIVSNPLGAIVNVMASMNYAASYGLGFMYTVTKASTSVIHLLEVGINTYEEDYESNKDMTKGQLIRDILKGLGNMILNIFTGITNVIKAGFQGAFATFSNIITSMLKLLKHIFETSPFVKHIYELITLISSIFFFPFMTAFGEPLLDTLSRIISNVYGYGFSYSETLTKDSEKMSEFKENLKDIFTHIKYFALYLIEEFVPAALLLIKPISNFLVDFTDTLIKNSQQIFDLLNTGIDVFDVLTNGDILSKFLKFGTSVFKFIEENADVILGIFRGVFSFMKSTLIVYSVIIKNIRTIMYLLLSLVGAAVGTYLGAKVGSIGAILSLGLTTVIGAAAGLTTGAAVGAAMAYDIDQNYLKPIELDESAIPEYYKGGKITYTPGGRIGIFAERGQGEYIIPESKVELFRGPKEIIINFKGRVYNLPGLKSEIRSLNIGKVTDIF